MPLTLPIVVGKIYVRRDGATVAALPHPMASVVYCGFPNEAAAWKSSGRVWGNTEHEADLVADYIAHFQSNPPAKSHPHAALMAQFAEDAKETETPWDRWEFYGPFKPCNWQPCSGPPNWGVNVDFRRKAVITPDPHAESMRLYAEDAAQTDKAWERWQARLDRHDEWRDCTWHPGWLPREEYRRKPVA